MKSNPPEVISAGRGKRQAELSGAGTVLISVPLRGGGHYRATSLLWLQAFPFVDVAGIP